MECVCVCVCFLFLLQQWLNQFSFIVLFVRSLCDKNGSMGSKNTVVHSFFLFVSFRFVSAFLSSLTAAPFSMRLGKISINNLNLHDPNRDPKEYRPSLLWFSVDQILGKTDWFWFGDMPTSEPIIVGRGVDYSGHSRSHPHMWEAELWEWQRAGMGQEGIVLLTRKECWVNNSCLLISSLQSDAAFPPVWLECMYVSTFSPNSLSSILLTHCAQPICPIHLYKSKWLVIIFF